MVNKIRNYFISFLECEVRGEWTPQKFPPPSTTKSTWVRYMAINQGCEVWVVRPDGLRRAWKFKQNAPILINQSTLLFNDDDVIDEIAVDEDKQQGKKGVSKVI